jgi:triosephosphate isomerase
VQAVIRNELIPVLCVGETAEERANNETKHVLHDQITGGLANVSSEEIGNVVIAYEPVWAISNGTDFADHIIPTLDDLEKVRDIIRHQVKSLYGEAAEKNLRLLYGASVNADNVAAFLSVPGINGLLVGGASLHLEGKA